MGRGASDSEATFSPDSSFLSATNVCEVDTAGQVKVWLHTGYKCRQNARRKSAAVADMKELLLLVCIVLSYCFYGVSGSDEVLKRKAYPVNDSSSTRLIFWSVRAVGVAFAALILILLFPSFHLWPPEDTTIPSTSVFSSVDAAGYNSVTGSSMRGSVRFQEAPSVRNGDRCPTSSIRSEDELVCDPALVHIAMTLDTTYLRGSMAGVFSILQHANCPENVFFHFLVTEGEREYRALMRSTFPHLHFKIYHFEESLVKDRISSSVREALEQPLNYARSYLAELLERCIERVIYLDSDLVVVDDIAKLWATRLGPGTVLGAPEYCHANFTKYFAPSFWEDARLASTFEGRMPCYFNTGVMVMDLAKWREGNCTREIERWMDVQKERRIYELGSLPPFLLVFAGSVEPVEHRWNQHGLGGDTVRGSCRSLHPGPVSLLHWSGEGKPWVRLDSRQPCPLDNLWAPYDLYYASSFF